MSEFRNASSKGLQFSHWIWIHSTLTEDRMATSNYCGHQLKNPKGNNPTHLVEHAALEHGKTETSGRSGTVPAASTSSTVTEVVVDEREKTALDDEPMNNGEYD